MSGTSEYLMRAAALAGVGQLGEAILVLEQAVERCEDDAAVTKQLARLNLSINEVRAFQNWCHESLRIAPQDPEPHRMLAAYFRSTGRLGEAQEEERLAQALAEESAVRMSSSGGTRA
ncbi:MAG: hypothetical protein OHK0021_06260 [Bryobacter sp.]